MCLRYTGIGVGDDKKSLLVHAGSERQVSHGRRRRSDDEQQRRRRRRQQQRRHRRGRLQCEESERETNTSLTTDSDRHDDEEEEDDDNATILPTTSLNVDLDARRADQLGLEDIEQRDAAELVFRTPVCSLSTTEVSGT